MIAMKSKLSECAFIKLMEIYDVDSKQTGNYNQIRSS